MIFTRYQYAALWIGKREKSFNPGLTPPAAFPLTPFSRRVIRMCVAVGVCLCVSVCVQGSSVAREENFHTRDHDNCGINSDTRVPHARINLLVHFLCTKAFVSHPQEAERWMLSGLL